MNSTDPKKQKNAIERLQRAAEEGSVEAQSELALHYLKGDGVEKNPKLAAQWMQHALALIAASESAEAQEKADKKAQVSLEPPKGRPGRLREKAEAGDPDAQYRLGRKLLRDQKISSDLEEAVRLIGLAAKQGHTAAQVQLGHCFLEGVGCPRDREKAVFWFEKAAADEDARAQYLLGRCYFKGCGVDMDPGMAVDLFRESAEQGYAQAQYALGRCFFYGTGVEKNKEAAFRWLSMAVEQRHARAQELLDGICFNRLNFDLTEDDIDWQQQEAERICLADDHTLFDWFELARWPEDLEMFQAIRREAESDGEPEEDEV